ncbi:MAG TPA: hypothetical protein VLA09_11750, partial [Longimicrobiales bacterium]|nr:hypothetical protein [Longimicrobiales bacterium]
MRARARLATEMMMLAGWLAPASAQVVPLRTVPVASGDQFLMLPSATVAMGGVRLAVDDSLADAWSNPAKGVLVEETALLGSPTYYAISNDGGGGRTLPFAGLFVGSSWFGGAALALQQVEHDRSTGLEGDPWIDSWPEARRLSDRFARNLYASGYFGRRLGSDWSIGLGVSASRLDAMDGVDLLYAGADRIEQSGGAEEVRVGAHHDGDGDRLSLLLLHSRLSMTHD